jgi:uncharacterized protein
MRQETKGEQKMKKWKLWMMLLISSLIVGACSSNSSSTDSSGSEDLFVTIATGGTSGVYYPIGGAMASVFEEALGIDTSVQSTGASIENINLITNDLAELAITMSDAVQQAYEGSGAFEGETPNENLRGLISLYPNYVQIVTTKDSGIETVYDLKGKRVGVGAPNSGVELNARIILDAYGLTYDDMEVDYLSYKESIDQMKNGMIDAAFVTSGIPNSTVIDLATSHDVEIIPIEGKELEKLTSEYSFFTEGTIPKGTYENEEDISTVSIMNILLVNKNLSEEVVYDLTKAIFEHIDDIHASHNSAKNITLDTATDGMVVPLHPGAEKYLKEKGVIE